jgi:endonuclease/exonuclease/phosphatase family metal-dependent hydrolase
MVAADPKAIRILTVNLLDGGADPSALVDLIAELRVDVACVQELGSRLAKAIAQVLPEGRLQPDAHNRGLGIASSRRVDVESFPLPKRDGLAARLSPASWPPLAEPIQIVNVHIMGPHTWPYFPSRNTRAGQLAGLLRFLDGEPRAPRAVLGDFNSSPIWPLYRRMAARYADGARVAERAGSPLRPTWPHVPMLGLRGLLRIDHCFLFGLTARAARVVPIRGSDHLGLCVDVAPEPTAPN